MEDLFTPEFWAIVDNRMKEGQRRGQAIFNTAYFYFMPEVRKIECTVYDCFYDDRKIPGFLERLVDLLTK